MLKSKLVALTVASAAALALAPSAHAATDYFMRVDPVTADQAVKGEALDKDYKDWIQLKSFDFGVENPTTIGSQTGGAGTGKAKLNELHVEKSVDSTTPLMLQRLATGSHFAGIEIVARKSGMTGAAATNPTRYYFSMAFPTEQVQIGDAGDDVPTEKLTFVYGALAMKTFRQTPGTTTGANAFGQWNQVLNSTQIDKLPGEMVNP
jgi:type VI secretion system secreted protein Hcp